jgi:hypothetical protein
MVWRSLVGMVAANSLSLSTEWWSSSAVCWLLGGSYCRSEEDCSLRASSEGLACQCSPASLSILYLINNEMDGQQAPSSPPRSAATATLERGRLEVVAFVIFGRTLSQRRNGGVELICKKLKTS